MVEELVEYLKCYCKSQLLRARFQDNRIQTQLTVVSEPICRHRALLMASGIPFNGTKRYQSKY
jgi:hypothetical protein